MEDVILIIAVVAAMIFVFLLRIGSTSFWKKTEKQLKKKIKRKKFL